MFLLIGGSLLALIYCLIKYIKLTKNFINETKKLPIKKN